MNLEAGSHDSQGCVCRLNVEGPRRVLRHVKNASPCSSRTRRSCAVNLTDACERAPSVSVLPSGSDISRTSAILVEYRGSNAASAAIVCAGGAAHQFQTASNVSATTPAAAAHEGCIHPDRGGALDEGSGRDSRSATWRSSPSSFHNNCRSCVSALVARVGVQPGLEAVVVSALASPDSSSVSHSRHSALRRLFRSLLTRGLQARPEWSRALARSAG